MRSELWLTEGVRMEAVCRDPAELLTAFCLEGIDASDFRCTGDNRFRFDIPAYAADRARTVGNRTGTEISVVRRIGFLHFLRRFRKRAYLLQINFSETKTTYLKSVAVATRELLIPWKRQGHLVRLIMTVGIMSA